MSLTHSKRLAYAAELPEDRSVVVQHLLNGWSIRRLQFRSDMLREGELMSNCWRWLDDKDLQKLPWRVSMLEDGVLSVNALAWMEPEELALVDYALPDNASQPSLYSLRDPDNLPHLCFSLHAPDESLGLGKLEDTLGRHNADPKAEHLKQVYFWVTGLSDDYLHTWSDSEDRCLVHEHAVPMLSRSRYT